jgi:hypothetical protein
MYFPLFLPSWAGYKGKFLCFSTFEIYPPHVWFEFKENWYEEAGIGEYIHIS